VARFREFFTERVIDVHPSFEQGEPGEIVLARTIEFDGVVYFWGDIKAFPGAKREAIESMVIDKLVLMADDVSKPEELYERFMKFAGPYWMSVIANNHELPILSPDHYLTYLEPE
jgi:hypothetical protein